MLTTLVFLLIITVSVIIHELAHFFAAKSVGVPVRAFSVGMGPVVWRRQWRGTEWRLSLLPLGGYVDLPGLAAETDEQGNLYYPEDGFASKNLWQKLWVLAGGVIANFVLAILLVATVVTVEPLARADIGAVDIDVGTEIVQVMEGSAAERVGLQPGDRVRDANGVENPSPEELQRLVSDGGPLSLTLVRNGDTVAVEVDMGAETAPDGERPLLGISMTPYVLEAPPPVSFPRAVVESTGFFVGVVPMAVTGFVRGVGEVLSGRRSENLAGPVGIVQMTHRAVQTGPIMVLFFAGIINFSLAVFNLLPIPGLDGGRMLLAGIIAVRGKPLKAGQEEFIHFLGFMALMAFFVLITFSELGRLFG